MNKCGDCIHFKICEPYTTKNECFPEVNGCKAFEKKPGFDIGGSMAKEYIEREKAVEMIKTYGINAIEDGLKTLDPVDDIVSLEKFVDLIPTADVVEVKHSYWQCSNVRMSSRDITCRYCHRTETISNGSEDFEYCPHCGAKMDGKDGE